MDIMHVTEYNAQQYIKYKEAVAAWQPFKGGFPYIGFYLFFDEEGNKRKEGYVLIEGKRHTYIEKCPHLKTRFLNCEEHKGDCQEIVCCGCGESMPDEVI